jgi:hypothetical protein
MLPSDIKLTLNVISLVFAGISLFVSGYVAYRTIWKDRPSLKIYATSGMLLCKFFSATSHMHFVAIARLVNSGFVPITITDIGIFSVSKRRFRTDIPLDYSSNCLFNQEGELFMMSTLDPGEVLNIWMNPKRVDGYEILINSEFPNKKVDIGFFAQTIDGKLYKSIFHKDTLAGFRILILPPESEKQPNVFWRVFPPLPEDLMEHILQC